MEFNSKNIKKILLVAFFVAVIFFLIFNLGGTVNFIGIVINILSPVIAAGCIAFVLNVLLAFLEERVFGFMDKSKRKFVNKMRRPLCLTLTYVISLGIIVSFVLFILPLVAQTLLQVIEKLPTFFASAREWALAIFERHNIDVNIPELKVDWKTVITFLTSWLDGTPSKLVGDAVNVTASVIGSVFDVVLSLALSVYILAQKEKISSFADSCLEAFTSEKTTKNIRHIVLSAKNAFSGFIAGQVVEAFILAGLCFVGMLCFGFPHAIVISTVVCIMALIPVIGATISGVVGFLLIAVTDPIKAILFVVFILVLQQIEGNLIYPRTMGKAVGIPGILVLSAVLVGGKIAGILGSLVAVPTLALIYALVKEEVVKRKSLKKQTAK